MQYFYQAKIDNNSDSDDLDSNDLGSEDSDLEDSDSQDSDPKQYNLAMVSVYSHAIQNHLDDSFGTLRFVEYQGKELLEVIDVKSICSVVAMVPFILTEQEKTVPAICEHYSKCFFVGEKPFLNFTSTTGPLQQERSEEAQTG